MYCVEEFLKHRGQEGEGAHALAVAAAASCSHHKSCKAVGTGTGEGVGSEQLELKPLQGSMAQSAQPLHIFHLDHLAQATATAHSPAVFP